MHEQSRRFDSACAQVQQSAVNLKESLLKGTGHYRLLLKIIVSMKTYLVTSNGELLTAPSEKTKFFGG